MPQKSLRLNDDVNADLMYKLRKEGYSSFQEWGEEVVEAYINDNLEMKGEDNMKEIYEDINEWLKEVDKMDNFKLPSEEKFFELLDKDREKKLEEYVDKELSDYAGSEGAYGRVYDLYREGWRLSDKGEEAKEFYSDPNNYIDSLYNDLLYEWDDNNGY